MEELFDAFFWVGSVWKLRRVLEFCCIIEFNNGPKENQVFDWNNKGKKIKGSGSNPEIKIRYLFGGVFFYHFLIFFLIFRFFFFKFTNKTPHKTSQKKKQ
jgi:hypothetical protein